MKILKYTILGFILFGFVMGLGVLGYVWMLSTQLPSITELNSFQYKEPTIVFDEAGKVIAELGNERRYPVPIDQIPLHLQNGIVAVEDSRFYEHGGVDFLGIFRAFVANVKAGRVVEGGSTLTQQLVKVLYLTPEKKLKRKIKEAILAYRLDKYLSKDKILELYINQVYFGRGAYGVEAAAVNYFGKHVWELSLAECALIAGLPKAPGIYAPHLRPERALTRRNHVLARMLEEGYITEETWREAVVEPIVITKNIPAKLEYAGYFVDYVLSQIGEIFPREDLREGGFRIHTTLNLDWQRIAESSVRENLVNTSMRQGFYGPLYRPLTAAEKQLIEKIDAMDNESLAEVDNETIERADSYRRRMNVDPDKLSVPSYLDDLEYKLAKIRLVTEDYVYLSLIDTEEKDENEDEKYIDVTADIDLTAILGPKDNESFGMDNTSGNVLLDAADNSSAPLDNMSDNMTAEPLFDGAIVIEDVRWAHPSYEKNARRLTDFRDIMKRGDIIYVRQIDGTFTPESEQETDNATELQKFVIAQDPNVEGAILSIDPTTGAIKAMVGGFDYRKSMFNRAVQAKRQVGSLFKPIVYSAALENGFSPMSQIFDAPVMMEINEEGDFWKPTNYSETFYGFTTLKEALTKSRNVVTIKIAEKIGVRTIKKYARKFGITSDLEDDLSISIGSGTVNLIEMVDAFSVFPNLGQYNDTHAVTRIENKAGDVVLDYVPAPPKQVIRPATAQMITDILVNVVQNGTGWRAKRIPRVIAGKTGTTNDYRDAWFMGFMPNYITGSWTGLDNFRSIGETETGSRAAAPAWVDFTRQVVDSLPPKVFPATDTVTYFKVDTESYEVTDSFSDNYTFEAYEVLPEMDNATVDPVDISASAPADGERTTAAVVPAE